MFSVCSTAPMQGMARYASRWPWLFQQKVPTRSPCSMPSRVRAAASFSARAATSAKVAERCPPSSTVMTVLSPCTCCPWSRMSLIRSGASCMVLFMLQV